MHLPKALPSAAAAEAGVLLGNAAPPHSRYLSRPGDGHERRTAEKRMTQEYAGGWRRSNRRELDRPKSEAYACIMNARKKSGRPIATGTKRRGRRPAARPLSAAGLLAPCGVNCARCLGYQRERNRCPGCASRWRAKPAYCRTCRIANCPELAGRRSRFCFVCNQFPCRRLRQLATRYRTRYGTDLLANLEAIRTGGRQAFVRSERRRWPCPQCGKLRCMHRPQCLHCGAV